MSKILIVEDDIDLQYALRTYFVSKSFVTEVCGSGEDALQLLASYQYDIIVLDWGLPRMSGNEVLRTFRKKGGQTPIVMLTGKNDINNIEEGFDSGADDYITKPFNMRELFARVEGMLRRRTGAFVSELKIGNLELRPETHHLVKGDTKLQLRAKETSLLEYLMRHPDQSFNAQELLDAVWSSEGDVSVATVRTWMNLLRRKLESIDEGDFIKTIVGSGYIIETGRDK